MRSVLCWSIEPLRVGVCEADATKGSGSEEFVGVCGDVGCLLRSFASSASYSAQRADAAAARSLRKRTSFSSSAMRARAVVRSEACDLSSGDDDGGRSQPHPGQFEPGPVRSVVVVVGLVSVTTIVDDMFAGSSYPYNILFMVRWGIDRAVRVGLEGERKPGFIADQEPSPPQCRRRSRCSLGFDLPQLGRIVRRRIESWVTRRMRPWRTRRDVGTWGCFGARK
jgi:hypothetical protein